MHQIPSHEDDPRILRARSKFMILGFLGVRIDILTIFDTGIKGLKKKDFEDQIVLIFFSFWSGGGRGA